MNQKKRTNYNGLSQQGVITGIKLRDNDEDIENPLDN